MLDILILVPVAVGLLTGWRSGLVRQLVGLAGLAAAVILGIRYASSVGHPIVDFLGLGATYANIAGFIAVFCGIYLVVVIVMRITMAMVEGFQLRGLNHFLGAVLGGLKWTLIVGAILMGLEFWHLPPRELRDNSVLYPYVMQVMDSAWEYFGD